MSMTFEFVSLVSFTILTTYSKDFFSSDKRPFLFLNPVTNTNFLNENNETNLIMHLFLELDKLIDRIFNIFEKT